MRLLRAEDLTFKQYARQRPLYAALSHRWNDTEPTLQDVKQGSPVAKIQGFADFINEHLPHIDWIWVDSCCIEQHSAAELSEAVNLMFDWYKSAAVCVAYIADVDAANLRHSVWFKRGWTLQELLASKFVLFVDKSWRIIGHKGSADLDIDIGPNLEGLIAEVTGIPLSVLQDFDCSHTLSVEERMSWMHGRETLREEDKYYAQFGVFGVTPGANYGERQAGAERRLREAIAQRTLLTQPRRLIPFARNPGFVHRSELDTLRERLSDHGRVALIGLGGIGKTELAIECCWSLADTWVIWLHASSAARFDQEVAGLVNDLGLHSSKDISNYQLLRTWLSQRQWLIVLDNADDADFLFQAPGTESKPRIDWLPTHGSIILTTRYASIARQFTDEASTIAVRHNEELAIEILQNKLGNEHVAELAEALEYIPLACSQAAAYINQRKSRFITKDYIIKLKDKPPEVLGLPTTELRRDRMEASNCIFSTWHISFEHIQKVRPAAANLLSLLSFYDHQGIPDELLKPSLLASIGLPRNIQDSTTSRNDLNESFELCIMVLRDYSFISVSPDKSVKMHRLVQLAARLWLEERQQYRCWLEHSLCVLCLAYPMPSYKNHDKCRVLQPHAKLYTAQQIVVDLSWEQVRPTAKDRIDNATMDLGHLMYKSGGFIRDEGQLEEAAAIITLSLNTIVSVLGEEHYYCLKSMGELSRIYYELSRFDEAEALQRRHVAITQKQQGSEHDETLSAMSDLALTLSRQGDFEESVELAQKVILTRTTLAGNPLELAVDKCNLAKILKRQWRYAESKQLLEEALAAEAAVLSPDNLTLSSTKMSLARVCLKMRQFDRAQMLAEETVRSRVQTQGDQHLDTALARELLARIYSNQNRHTEAEALQRKVVATMSALFGGHHIYTYGSCSNLVRMLLRQHKTTEASELANDTTQGLEALLGFEHEETLQSAESLARARWSQKHFAEAVVLGEKVVEAYKRKFGEDHVCTLSAVNNVASFYSGGGDTSKAEELQRHVLERWRQLLGNESSDTLLVMRSLCNTYQRQGRLREAHQLACECLATCVRLLGDNHPDTQEIKAKVGLIEKLLSQQAEEAKQSQGDTCQVGDALTDAVKGKLSLDD